MTGTPSGFRFQIRKGGEVILTHNGKHAATLRGQKAAGFLAEMEGASSADQQETMARLTGNYRRGNERLAKGHPRNG